MYSPFQLALRYLSYYLRASNGRGHGMHSPFVFEYITQVLNDNTPYPVYRELESVRGQWLRNRTEVEVRDFGAGSGKGLGRRRKISDIASSALKSPKYAQLLYRMVRHYRPLRILELGTCLGLTTAYMARASPEAEICTLEGAPALADWSRQFLDEQGTRNVQVVTGPFDETLPALLSSSPDWDFVFMDGHHQKEATLRYWDWIRRHCHEKTIVVLDDIHWSKGMEEAWQEIRQADSVKASMDLFFIGIVLMDASFREPVHTMIRF